MGDAWRKRPLAGIGAVFGALDYGDHGQYARPALESFPEIDCVRHMFSSRVIMAAEHRAAALHVGADEVLVAFGYLSEQRYQRALAASFGLPFAELDSTPRALCPLSDANLVLATHIGMLPLTLRGQVVWALAPRRLGARYLVLAARADPMLRRRILICSREQIHRFVQRHACAALTWTAAEWLREEHPDYSAATSTHRLRWAAIAVIAASIFSLVLAPSAMIIATQLAISAVFLAWTMLRLAGAAMSRAPGRLRVMVADSALPVYSIVVALYREAAAIPDLVASLKALDYPA